MNTKEEQAMARVRIEAMKEALLHGSRETGKPVLDILHGLIQGGGFELHSIQGGKHYFTAEGIFNEDGKSLAVLDDWSCLMFVIENDEYLKGTIDQILKMKPSDSTELH